jgi:predicted nucleic acid-binding protein
VIADAGPLIGLARVGLLHLLRHLYGRVVVPVEVLEELQIFEERPGSKALAKAVDEKWIEVCSPEEGPGREALSLALGPGEASAILLAEQGALPVPAAR